MADIDALNIRHPDVICKATEHIQEMIDLIKQIEANGHTYMAGGNLYYDISTYEDYGKLANLNLDELKATKKNPSERYNNAKEFNEDLKMVRDHPELFKEKKGLLSRLFGFK